MKKSSLTVHVAPSGRRCYTIDAGPLNLAPEIAGSAAVALTCGRRPSELIRRTFSSRPGSSKRTDFAVLGVRASAPGIRSFLFAETLLVLRCDTKHGPETRSRPRSNGPGAATSTSGALVAASMLIIGTEAPTDEPPWRELVRKASKSRSGRSRRRRILAFGVSKLEATPL